MVSYVNIFMSMSFVSDNISSYIKSIQIFLYHLVSLYLSLYH